MVKGFISFRGGKIPFVIENYRMELFTDDSLLDNFCKEYNFKENYILHRSAPSLPFIDAGAKSDAGGLGASAASLLPLVRGPSAVVVRHRI